MNARRVIVPLKFNSGDLVRNLEGLKKKFTDSPNEIIKLIVGGELKKFFYGICRDELRDIAAKKESGASEVDIFHELAKALNIEAQMDASSISSQTIISHTEDLKTQLESSDMLCEFPRGTWEAGEQIVMRAVKSIKGAASSATLFIVSGLLIDITDPEPVEMKGISFRKFSENEAVIEVRNGNVIFRDLVFDGVRLESRNNSRVNVENCAFVSTSTALTVLDESDIELDLNTRFEKVGTNITSQKIIEEAKRKAEEAKRQPYICPESEIEFVFVTGGCFEMGDIFGGGGEDEKPVHEVCLDDFFIGKYPVTQGQWKKLMENNPAHFSKDGDNCPVESVSWNDAQEFIKKLNQKTGMQYRLPTEAEWEFAARSGGKKEEWAGTSVESDLGEYAWYDKNSENKIHPVGLKQPNGLGLYDMIGNVRELCEDWFDERYYQQSPKTNPQGPQFGYTRVLRGGSWRDKAWFTRVANRFREYPDNNLYS